MKTKLYSILTALTMLMPTFAVTAKADEPSQVQNSSEYYRFYEDFSEYDETNSVASWPVGELENGEPKVVAERADGTKWVCSTTWPGGPSDRRNATVKINTANDTMTLIGWGDWTAMVFLDNADEFEIGEIQKIRFKTQRGQRYHGMVFFMNQTRKSYIYFGQSDTEGGGVGGVRYIPYVEVYSGGSLMERHYDASNSAGFVGNDQELNWDIEIDGTYMRWTATSGQGKTWSGSTHLDEEVAEELFSNYEYLAGFADMGDSPAATLYNFEYETGRYYSPEMGEPREVLYKDLFAGAEDVTAEFGLDENDTHKIYKFAEAAPIRRMICAEGLSDVELSADGVAFDTFDFSGAATNRNQLNTRTQTEYQYLKVPHTPVGNFKLFTEIKSGDTLTLRKGGTGEMALYRNGSRVASAPFSSSDSNYAAVTVRGVISCLKEGTVQISLDGEKEEYVININIEGPLSDALKALESGDDTLMRAYVATQQVILNDLNTAISENNLTAVQNFFGTTINDIDLIDSKPFIGLKMTQPIKFREFASRMLTYTDGFQCAESPDEIEEIEKEFLRELAVGNIEGLANTDAVISAIEGNKDILELELSDKYYKERKRDIAGDFVNTSFANHDDLIRRVSESTVIANLKYTISADFVNNLLKDFQNTIGYNTTHYNSISDKTAFANALIARKGIIQNVEAIKTFVDTYTAAPVPTPNPGYTPGGGGGGSSQRTEYVDTKGNGEADEKTEKEPAVDNAQIFSDIPTDHWCYEAIRYLKAKNSISGYDDGSFKPNNSVTRAEFIKMLVGIFAGNTELTEDFVSQFTDLNGTEWYYDSMAKAEQMGILQGTDGACNPGESITRQEIAVITYRMIETLGKTINRESTIEKFADEEEIAPWADTIVLKMQAAGIINGTDGKFMPNDTATRTMAAQILYKAVLSFENPAE